MPTATSLNTILTSDSLSSLDEFNFDEIYMATGASLSNSVNNTTYHDSEILNTTTGPNSLYIATGGSPESESSITTQTQTLPSSSLSSSSSSTFVTIATPTPQSDILSINSSALSPSSTNGAANLPSQKQHQIIYIQKQQSIQQQKQRLLLYYQQGLRQQQERQIEKKKHQKEKHFLPHQEQKSVLETCFNGLKLHQVQQAPVSNELTDMSKKEENHQCVVKQTTIQPNNNDDIIAHIEVCPNPHTNAYSDTIPPTNSRSVDLVDDVWQLIFYVLAGDCKDLGRSMQVNRRFHNLIANDAVLWRLSYHLTVSGSIFGSQKPLLSPTWIRKEHNLFSNNLVEGSTTELSQDSHVDMNEENLSLETLSNSIEPRHPTRYNGNEGLSTEEHAMSSTSRRSSLVVGQGLQIPSPLILPHHRRIIQNISSSNLAASTSGNSDQSAQEEGSTGSANLQPIVDRSIDFQSISQGTAMSPSSSSNSLNSFGSSPLSVRQFAFGRTPASTPSSMCVSSFQLNIPPMTSQVVSNSTTPFSAINSYIPTTTLMHRHPAVYWKNQVVEWLEREKLRCLRLGLFWGFNATASRMHGRRSNNSCNTVSC